MLVTVTNTSGAPINGLASGGTGIAPDATSPGHRVSPLPYPFGHIGELADSASKVLPMHPEDFGHKPSAYLPETPRIEWNKLVQAGTVTFAVAQQAAVGDVEEVAIGVI